MELIKRIKIFKRIDISIDVLSTRVFKTNNTLYLLPGIAILHVKEPGYVLPVFVISLSWLYGVIFINIFRHRYIQ